MAQSLLQTLALFALGGGLAQAAVAQREALDRLSQDAEAITVPLIRTAGSVEAIELPAMGRVRAIACSKTDIWLVCNEIIVITVGDVLVSTPKERRVRRRLPVPKGLLGLAADDRFFYVLLRHSIVVMDATTGHEVRRMELPDNRDQAPVSIGAHGDELFVAWPDGLMALHKRTTKVRECSRLRSAPRWLASDGKSLWRGGAWDLARVAVSPAGKKPMSRSLPKSFVDCLATFAGGKLLLVKNRDAADKRVVAALLEPQRAFPVELLSIALRRDALGVRYQVGPKPIASANGVARELGRISIDPSAMVPGPNGEPVLAPVMLVVYPGVTVRELCEAWDLVSEAGFFEVHCISHKARVRPAQAPPPPPPPRPPGRQKR